MECLSKLSRWLFGVKWNRSEAKAKMEQMIKQEEDNASFLLDLAYQNAMKQMAEVPEEDRVQSTQIADALLIRLAAIRMEKDASVSIIREEFEKLDKRMSRLSQNFILRWLGGSGE